MNSMGKRKIPDQIDCRMIELLQKDGRISNTDIAKKIGISEATVRTRLNRLIEEEYIQIVAVSNPMWFMPPVIQTYTPSLWQNPWTS